MNPKYSKIFGISSARYCNGKYKRKKPHEQVFALKSSEHPPIGVLKKRWRVQGGSLGCRTLIINHPPDKAPYTPWQRIRSWLSSAKGIRADSVRVVYIKESRLRPWNLPYSNFSFDPWQSWIDNWKLRIPSRPSRLMLSINYHPSSIIHQLCSVARAMIRLLSHCQASKESWCGAS